ncbi:hypothetical protein ABPG72_010069 [Tetrahymena utriculariae]
MGIFSNTPQQQAIVKHTDSKNLIKSSQKVKQLKTFIPYALILNLRSDLSTNEISKETYIIYFKNIENPIEYLFIQCKFQIFVILFHKVPIGTIIQKFIQKGRLRNPIAIIDIKMTFDKVNELVKTQISDNIYRGL